jgi:hypothetical protein
MCLQLHRYFIFRKKEKRVCTIVPATVWLTDSIIVFTLVAIETNFTGTIITWFIVNIIANATVLTWLKQTTFFTQNVAIGTDTF